MEALRLNRTDNCVLEDAEMQQRVAFVEALVARGGPRPSEYAAFNRWIQEVADGVRMGRISEGELARLREAFGAALSPSTMQGLSFTKPRGYSGDFEIIDRIYRHQVTDDPHLRNWDLYCHAQSASVAVRNRKEYFIRLLSSLTTGGEGQADLAVLNLASGPCRDVSEFFSREGRHESPITFECVDADGEAIEFAKRVCAPYLDRMRFIQANALRFTSKRPYRLIWSAGLFDYLGEKGFRFLLENLLSMLQEGGELVIGNFGTENPTRPYMEVVTDWHLHHRSERHLRDLALGCGVRHEDIRIGREPEGVNLFLHVKRGGSFIDMGRGDRV